MGHIRYVMHHLASSCIWLYTACGNGVVRCCVSQGLIDILTSLTRSAGAASRIFSLMDSLPDIDINRGIPVQAKDIKGNIEFRNVQFTYQMRPDHKVCLL
jgi:ABC-type multidrug transport system fused ATPase/permease subunit